MSSVTIVIGKKKQTDNCTRHPISRTHSKKQNNFILKTKQTMAKSFHIYIFCAAAKMKRGLGNDDDIGDKIQIRWLIIYNSLKHAMYILVRTYVHFEGICGSGG